MRYWFLKLNIQSGEYEVSTSNVHRTKGRYYFDAEGYAKNYWCDGEETYGDGRYYFDAGCIACSVDKCVEITEDEYNVFKKYL